MSLWGDIEKGDETIRTEIKTDLAKAEAEFGKFEESKFILMLEQYPKQVAIVAAVVALFSVTITLLLAHK